MTNRPPERLTSATTPDDTTVSVAARDADEQWERMRALTAQHRAEHLRRMQSPDRGTSRRVRPRDIERLTDRLPWACVTPPASQLRRPSSSARAPRSGARAHRPIRRRTGASSRSSSADPPGESEPGDQAGRAENDRAADRQAVA